MIRIKQAIEAHYGKRHGDGVYLCCESCAAWADWDFIKSSVERVSVIRDLMVNAEDEQYVAEFEAWQKKEANK